MKPSTVMGAGAVVFGGLGLALVFAPVEVGGVLGLGGPAAELALQLAGAGMAAFGLLDWAGRGAIYGGIYGRPIALGNFLFGVLVATSVAREATAPAGWAVAAVFGLLAVGFGWILFGRGSPTTGGTGPGASGS